ASTADRLGHGSGTVGHDGDAVVHRLEQRDAESFVVGAACEEICRHVVGDQFPGRDGACEVDCVLESQICDEAAQGLAVGRRGSPSDQTQTSALVVGTTVGGERLHQIVL